MNTIVIKHQPKKWQICGILMQNTSLVAALKQQLGCLATCNVCTSGGCDWVWSIMGTPGELLAGGWGKGGDAPLPTPLPGSLASAGSPF